ncbi:MAG: tRNA uridine-5-carboxymethylaminomethyl(34) synthesis GTPase MnmE [Methylacidiphilales bacterium]|nr:tRNA uridine-5-carboxymethylaminomethyl(34) synthesis GTPase MnmE [Candidatus Methylacidiphilales bacterium]
MASATGKSGIAVIRLSGLGCISLASRVCFNGKLRDSTPRLAQVVNLEIDGIIDQVVVITYQQNKSFTGEESLEIQCHGNHVLISIIIEACINGGARMANPGEFSERAYLHGKIDLAQAEAIVDLIHATTKRNLIACTRSLQGELSKFCKILKNSILDIFVEAEAHIDFSNEDIEIVSCETLASKSQSVSHELTTFIERCNYGKLITEGLHIAIAGKPNAGKSSLFNALVGEGTAIVSEMPGTTRDILKEQIAIAQIPITLYDTAGLRSSIDTIELIGQERAKQLFSRVDRIAYITKLDYSCKNKEDLEQMLESDKELAAIKLRLGDCPIDFIFTGSDLYPSEQKSVLLSDGSQAIILSTLIHDTLGTLLHHWESVVQNQQHSDNEFSARARHIQCLTKSRDHLNQAACYFSGTSENIVLACEELRMSLQAISELVGETTNDELLGKIFSTFCIGK